MFKTFIGDKYLGTAETFDSALSILSNYLKSIDYKVYYYRYWSQADEKICVDFGSHITFGYIVKETK